MKKLIAVILVVVFLLLIIAISIPFFIDLNKYKGVFISKIEQAIERDVEVGRAKLSLMKGIAVNLENVTISNHPAFKKESFLTLGGLELKVKFLPLLKKRVEIKNIALSSPKILIELNQQGTFNFHDLINPKKKSGRIDRDESPPIRLVSAETKSRPVSNPFLKNINISRFSIKNGKIKFVDNYTEPGKTEIINIKDLNLRADNLSLFQPIDFKLSLKIQATGEEKIDIKGKISPLGERPDLKKLDFNCDIKTKNLNLGSFNPYFKKYTPVIIRSGRLSTDISVSGNMSRQIMTDGRVSLKNFLLSDKKGLVTLKKALDLNIERKAILDLRRDSLIIEKLDLNMKENHFSVSGKVERLTKEPRFDLKVLSQKLSLSRLEEYYTPLKDAIPKGIKIKGPLSFSSNIQGTRRDLRLKGDLDLTGSQFILKGVLDKPEKMNAKLSYDFTVGKDRLTIRNAALNLKETNLKASGTIENFDRPLIDLHLKTDTINLNEWKDVLLLKQGKNLSGLIEIDAGLKGRTKEVSRLRLNGTIKLKNIEPLEEVMNLYSPDKKKQRTFTMKGKASLNAKVNGTLDNFLADAIIDLDQGEFNYAGLLTKPKGVPGNLVFIGGFEKNNITVKRLNLNLKDLKLSANGTIINRKRPKVDLSLSTNEINMGELDRLIPLLRQYQFSGRLKTDIKLKGDIAEMKNITLRGEASLSKVGAKLPFLPEKIHDFTGKISMSGNRMNIKNLTMGYGKTIINLDASVNDFDSPKIKFSLSSPNLRFDEFFSSLKLKKAGLDSNEENIVFVAQKKATKPSFLKRLTAEGSVKIGQGGYQNFDFANLKADLSFKTMTLTLKTLQFNLYKGLFTGAGQLDLRDKTPQFYIKSELKDVNVKELINDNTTQKDIVWGTLKSELSLFGRGTDAASITRTLNGKGKFAVNNGEINMALLRDILNQLPVHQLALVQRDFNRLSVCLNDYAKMERTNFKFLYLPLDVKRGVLYVPGTTILSSDLLEVVTDRSGGTINLNTMDIDFKNVTAVLTKQATDHCFGPKAQPYVVNEQGRAVLPFEWRGRIKEGKLPNPQVDATAILVRATRQGLIDRLIDKKRPPSTTPQPQQPQPQQPQKLEDLGKELLRDLLR